MTRQTQNDAFKRLHSHQTKQRKPYYLGGGETFLDCGGGDRPRLAPSPGLAQKRLIRKNHDSHCVLQKNSAKIALRK